jgi:hypothetical protein
LVLTAIVFVRCCGFDDNLLAAVVDAASKRVCDFHVQKMLDVLAGRTAGCDVAAAAGLDVVGRWG